MKRLKLKRKEIILRTNEVENAYEKYYKKHTKQEKENWYEILNKNFGGSIYE